MFVATNICRNKSFVVTKICLLRQKFCHDKTFVVTKIILVAAPVNDRCPDWLKCACGSLEPSIKLKSMLTMLYGKKTCLCIAHSTTHTKYTCSTHYMHTICMCPAHIKYTHSTHYIHIHLIHTQEILYAHTAYIIYRHSTH